MKLGQTKNGNMEKVNNFFRNLPKFNEDTWAAYTFIGCVALSVVLPFILYYTLN